MRAQAGSGDPHSTVEWRQSRFSSSGEQPDSRAKAPDQENCFDRLCDALLGSIFERALWKPCLLQHQARDRVRLEAVCKRFQEVVRVTGCLEWDLDNGPQTEQNFVRYALGSRCKGLLRKVVLKAERPLALMGVLQAVLPHLVNTLQEFYLVLDFSEEDAQSIDWGRILVMLQECKHLVALHIFLWESGWHRPAVVLDSSKLPKPFLKLRDLSLFGFAAPSTGIQSFFQSFPSLENVELHQLEGHDYVQSSSSSLKSAVLWGRMIYGLDGLVVPRSLRVVAGLLDSESSGVREKALEMLADLSHDGKPEKPVNEAIANAPGCLQKLVNLLGVQREYEQKEALMILDNLAEHWHNRMAIVTCPGSLQQLLSLFKSNCEDTRGTAASALGSLAQHPEACVVAIQLVPAILQGLVDLLDDEDRAMQSIALQALVHFANDYDNSAFIVALSGGLAKLVSLLQSGSAELATGAADCLQRLAKYDTAEAVARAPGCLEGLVNLLGSSSTHTREKAAWALTTLAELDESAQRIPLVPGFWHKLVECLDPSIGDDATWSEYLQEDAVSLLANVGSEIGVMEAIASIPGSLHVIVNVLDSWMVPSVRSAVWILLEMVRGDMQTRKALAELPGVLQKLEGIVDYEDFEDVHVEAAELLEMLR
ncbi:hypothetical protein KFL_003650030 [Klebsormidium nitens]|uniref:Vacuolar protein 8 n=1 Tax=Klebsormidium nitens TaxID=105231 RepID=A0A1Y1ICB7_KLENI|nr:hypothetical protein KFL_003650030 [Klebsormidium nitens]|eukprot:GAQ87612.1 hypothetical protein KFL_003650030 [Klebsormidium nitens]